jgi:hypothetical protein
LWRKNIGLVENNRFLAFIFVGDPHRNRHNMNLAENKPLPVPQFLKFNWQRFLSQITGNLWNSRKFNRSFCTKPIYIYYLGPIIDGAMILPLNPTEAEHV